jgi:TonB family protein
VQETDAPVQIIRGGENLLHGALPEYPRRAIEQHVEGDVLLDLTIDERGEVSDARVLSGPDELRRAALESVLQWHYSPAALRSTSTQAALRFRVPADSAENREMKERLDGEVVELKRAAVMFDKLVVARDFAVRHDGEHQAQRAERQLEELTKALEDPNITEQQRAELNAKYREAEERLAKARLMNEMAVKDHIRAVEREESVFSGPHQLAQVRSERVPQAVIESVLVRAGVKVGDVITEESEKRIVEAARSIDEHMKVSFVGDDDNATMTIVLVLP